MARPKKFDYDSDDFYDEILALSMQGLTDAEIADALDDKFGVSLSPEVFNCMKNGNYDKWSDEENERRSARAEKSTPSCVVHISKRLWVARKSRTRP